MNKLSQLMLGFDYSNRFGRVSLGVDWDLHGVSSDTTLLHAVSQKP